MTRTKQATSEAEDMAGLDMGTLETEGDATIKTAWDEGLEADTTLRLEREIRGPFADYPQLLLEVLLRPRNPLLERWDKADLLLYCIKNELFAKEWILTRDTVSKRDEHLIVKKVSTDWSADRIREWIYGKLVRKIPSHWVVFNLAGDTKPGMPHMRGVKSWITKRFHDCTFDLQWPLPTPGNPYAQGRENRCCVVDDDTVRAQLLYVKKPVTGEVIRRCVDPPKNRQPMYGLFKRDAGALVILERIYARGTRGNAALRQWAKEHGGLPTAL